jgi:biotin-(acetyl-CoA carboxylase) ligase
VLDIDDDCYLIVRFENGTVEALSTGEVSIRPL